MTRAVILSLGVNYRRLNAKGLGLFMGRGVYYGVPQYRRRNGASTVAVIGGANSAGQAAVNLAANPKVTVHIFVRKRISDGMSDYLIQKIKGLDNVVVEEHCEVQEVHGDTFLRGITYLREGLPVHMDLSAMYIFIGAIPKTLWLSGVLGLDKNKFIQTDTDLGIEYRVVRPYETSIQGVFAAGDVRSGSTKRIATAIGEGAAALQMVHRYLAA